MIGHSGLLRVFSLKNILAAMAGIGVSHRLTPYKIVGRSYLKKIVFFLISNILATMSHAQLISSQSLKCCEHFSDLGVEIALG